MLPWGEVSKVCPRLLITYETGQWLDWYTHYRNGLLPVAGGLLDQTALYIQAMTLLSRGGYGHTRS
jgi:hypothetical protein